MPRAEPGGRLRRRVDVPARRHSWPRSTSGSSPAGAGDRRRDGRRLGGARPDDVRSGTPVCGTTCAAPTCSTPAPRGTTSTSADGRHVAVGCIEPQFYAEMIETRTRPRPAAAPAGHQPIPGTPARSCARPSPARPRPLGRRLQGAATRASPDPVLRRNRDRTAQRQARQLLQGGRSRSSRCPAPRFLLNAARPARPPRTWEDTDAVLRDWA